MAKIDLNIESPAMKRIKEMAEEKEKPKEEPKPEEKPSK